MVEYNAADTKAIRRAAKAAKIASDLDAAFILRSMSSIDGRAWFLRLLERCHVFSNPFTGTASGTDFNCGELNIGQQVLLDIMAHAPDQYITMMRESNERRNNDNRPSGTRQNNGRDAGAESISDTGDGSVESEYEPGLDEDRTDAD